MSGNAKRANTEKKHRNEFDSSSYLTEKGKNLLSPSLPIDTITANYQCLWRAANFDQTICEWVNFTSCVCVLLAALLGLLCSLCSEIAAHRSPVCPPQGQHAERYLHEYDSLNQRRIYIYIDSFYSCEYIFVRFAKLIYYLFVSLVVTCKNQRKNKKPQPNNKSRGHLWNSWMHTS